MNIFKVFRKNCKAESGLPITSPSHQKTSTSLLDSLIHQRADTEAIRTTILQPVEQKPHSQIDKMKRQRAMYQMKEQDKTQEKQLKEVEIGNLPEKEFRIMIVKMIQDLRKRMEAKIEKMQEMFNKDLEELKNKQTEMNNTRTE